MKSKSMADKVNDTKHHVDVKPLNLQRIGPKPVNNYYESMKRRHNKNKDHDKYSEYIAMCDKKSMVPAPFGLVSYKGKEEEVNIKSFRMGNNYA
jgi:hypothetical protein